MAETLIVAAAALAGIAVNGLVTAVSAYWQWRSRRELRQVNQAVNQVEPGQPTLYSLVWENHVRSQELILWKRGYNGGPLDSGDKVVAFVDSQRQFVDDQRKHNDKVDEKLAAIEANCRGALCRIEPKEPEPYTKPPPTS